MNRFPNLFNPLIDPLSLNVDEMMKRQQERGLFHHHLRRLVEEYKPSLDPNAPPTQLIAATAEAQFTLQETLKKDTKVNQKAKNATMSEKEREKTNVLGPVRGTPFSSPEEKRVGATPLTPLAKVDTRAPQLYSTEVLPSSMEDDIGSPSS